MGLVNSIKRLLRIKEMTAEPTTVKSIADVVVQREEIVEDVERRFAHKRLLIVNNEKIASKFVRAVKGEFGDYLEIDPEDLLVTLNIPTKDKMNKEYNSLDHTKRVMYQKFEYHGVPVYFELKQDTTEQVSDQHYFIDVADFDDDRRHRPQDTYEVNKKPTKPKQPKAPASTKVDKPKQTTKPATKKATPKKKPTA